VKRNRSRPCDYTALKAELISFGENPPADYALAAREGVNNKRERLLRAGYVKKR
jgi:hypothetical protein